MHLGDRVQRDADEIAAYNRPPACNNPLRTVATANPVSEQRRIFSHAQINPGARPPPQRDIGRSMFRNESPVSIGLFYGSPLPVSTLPCAQRQPAGGQGADE